MTRRYFAILGAIGLGLGCLSKGAAGEKLFFALEVRDGAKVVARPKLVGVEGKPLKLYLENPGGDHTLRLALELDPSAGPSGYHVGLNLTIPGRLEGAKDQVLLGNGEEREVAWLGPDGDVRLKVMLMRVASPEFKAYIDLGSRTPGDGRT